MPSQQKFQYRILVVDDEEDIRSTVAALLAAQNYEVVLAADGFEALALMRGALPDLIISDLKMPNMSGFELLGVVRKRFPSVAVIAMSAEFRLASLPPELLVDRYLEKHQTPPIEIIEVVRELLESSPIRSQPAKAELAAVWVPRSATKYLVLTCPECLRSFSVRENSEDGPRPDESCPHCEARVQYCIDATVANQPPCKSRVDETGRIIESCN